MLDPFLRLAELKHMQDMASRPISRGHEGPSATHLHPTGADRAIAYESRAKLLQTAIGRELPGPIWECCKARCFSTLEMKQGNEAFTVEIVNIHMPKIDDFRMRLAHQISWKLGDGV